MVDNNLRPSFFGRYLNIGDALNTDEAIYLLGEGCRILPVYSGAAPAAPNEQTGEAAANKAIAAATRLSMAEGVVIYANIEGHWKPRPEYIIDWCSTLWGVGRGAGFYCNNWAQSDFMTAFKAAFGKMKSPMRERIRLWCQHPYRGCEQGQISSFSPESPIFYPAGPSVWQYARECFKFNQGGETWGLIDMNTATQGGFDAMWTP